MEKLCKKHNWL